MSYELFISLRHLRSKKSAFISVITVIAIVGIMVGVMALIIVLSVMKGFEKDVRDKILGANAHMVVSRLGGEIANYTKVVEETEKVEGVVAATPYIYNQVMLISQGTTTGVVLKGIDIKSIGRATMLPEKIKEGSIEGLAVSIKAEELPGILVGRELANNLGVFLGESIDVLSPTGAPSPLGMIPQRSTFKIAGIFDYGMYEYDSSLAFISLENAQAFFSMGDVATGVEVKVDEIYKTKEIGKRLIETLKDNMEGFYIIRDWMDLNRNLFSALKLERIAMFIILALIILVAAFNIVATLIMVVMEKGKEIGILISLGATRRSIMKIFMIEGIIIGVVGTILGVLGGLTIDIILKRYPIIELPKDIYPVSTLPVEIDTATFILVSIAALVISFLATLYPSWQASRLDPVEILRYE
ncbi:MAG: lipoprotein-releasing ABC transporter permease subunit [Thermodesulfobacteriota bacterium]